MRLRPVARYTQLTLLGAIMAATSLPLCAQQAPMTPYMQPDIGAKLVMPDLNDYVKRVVMIPMRDGVKLYTVIVVPKDAKRAPIMLTRTPYNAARRAERSASPTMQGLLPQGDDTLVEHGYIRVFQDVRGKYGSEGDYVMTRPVRGPLNNTKVDNTTDAWDTIDWLSKNIPESNGKVGMLGSSYEGHTVLMALVDPHPALKVAIPMSAMVDGWRGDDWFHNGAFRQPSLSYIAGQTGARSGGGSPALGVYDDYEAYLRIGSAGDFAKKFGIDKLTYTKKLFEHPAYDSYWQEQALDKILAKKPLTVPTMHVVGLWDQEDIYGPYATYAAMEGRDKNNNLNYLAVGPWRHSGVNYEGSSLGALKFDGDTARQFREKVMQPFLDQYLKDDAPVANTAPVTVYQSGTNQWQRLQRWPLACDTCDTKLTSIYLQDGNKLGFAAPQAGVDAAGAYDEYVSDPAKPVPFVPRPVRLNDGDVWKPWLVSDQRGYADRTDVLSYVSEPLKQAVRIAGAPVVNLFASTSGSDSDWVVKVIDVYPDEVPSQPAMGGYQLGVSMDIFRGRYRDSLEHPTAIPSGKVERYRFALPNANHVFLPGHRIAVQVQSSWFPLYDRNPQTFVPNIFLAQPGDYKKATQRVYHAAGAGSAIELPIVPIGQ
ncbi:CocE/NonD family hydrolase [Janthinobacterium sp.]|uniref:CocE/NonD family hydrolase n=1 Tax=Janthinobacterium sp. TaxID=1871054 RepID=UPI0026338210|nr:CocE/NonD family hydrolase [Janthinobacterium sp.]